MVGRKPRDERLGERCERTGGGIGNEKKYDNSREQRKSGKVTEENSIYKEQMELIKRERGNYINKQIE